MLLIIGFECSIDRFTFVKVFVKAQNRKTLMVFTGLTKMTTKAARKCRIWTTRMTSPTTTSTTAEAVPANGKNILSSISPVAGFYVAIDNFLRDSCKSLTQLFKYKFFPANVTPFPFQFSLTCVGYIYSSTCS